MGKYCSFFPGQYYDWEQADVTRIFQQRDEINAAPFEPDMDKAWEASERDIIAYNEMYNIYDPLYNDPVAAKKFGFPGVPAYPGYGERRIRRAEMVPFPKDIGDEFYFTNDGSTIEYFSQIFPGDQLIPCEKHMEVYDETVAGDTYRRWKFVGSTTYYDQNGKRKAKCTGVTRDVYRKYADGSPSMDISKNLGRWTEDFPPAHVTTDEDYQRMKEIWSLEEVRDDDAPFWEDVQVGSKLPRICTDGPVTYMHLMYWHNIGSLSIWTREELLSSETRRTVFRDPFGQFLDETSVHYGGRNIPGSRAVFYNYTAANLIARVVTNYIGSHGFVSSFGWKLYPFFAEMRTEPVGTEWMARLSSLPEMHGKTQLNRHGSEGDTVIGHGVVTDKYVDDAGNHVAVFTVWGETLDGDVIQVCEIKAVMDTRD